MKKLFAIALITMLLVFAVGISQETIYTNQATVAWDAVTTLDDGSQIPAENTVMYEVWIRKETEETFIAETDLLEYTITFSEEGTYEVGVRTMRYVADGEVIKSDINWSDVNGTATPNPFVIKYYKGVPVPENLRSQ